MDRVFLNTAFSLLLGVFTTFTLSFLGFIFGISINPIYPISGLLVTFCTYIFKLKQDNVSPQKIVKYTILLGFALVVLTFIPSLLMDPSYDGREYHQMGTILLEKGWNPIYDDIYAFCTAHFKNTHWSLIWNETYVKFSEIFAANILLLTGKIETGKVFNEISALIAFFYAFYVLSKPSFLRLDTKMRTIFSFLLVYNPIFLAQFFTYYIDGLLYLYFLIAVLALIDWKTELEAGKKATIAILFFIMASTVVLNIKLGGILCFICILLCAALFLVFGYFRPSFKVKIFNSKAFWTSVIIVTLLTLLSGINPYFTNISKGRHPLYPLAGREKFDIITPNMPKAFKDKPVAYKFFTSLFSRTDNFTFDIDRNPQLKIPLTVHRSELPRFDDPDARIAGFGVFFSGIFLLALALLFFTNYKTLKAKGEFAIIFTTFGLATILNPESWWARYIPQFWAVIIFIVIFAKLNPPKNHLQISFHRGITGTLLFFMFLNSFIISTASAAWAAKYTYRTKIAINKIKKLQKQDPTAIVRRMPNTEFASMEISYTRKLREAGVKYNID